MRKFVAYLAIPTFSILISLTAWAQRGGHFGGHASMGSGTSGSSMGRGGFESREPDFPTVRAGSNTNMQMRSNARLRTHGLETAEAKQSADTRADSKRGFRVAPGVEKAEARHSSRMHAHMRSNASLKTRGIERAETAQSANINAGSKRGFTIAPRVEKAEARHSSRMHGHRRSNASLKTRGHERADDSQSVEVGDSTHTSFGGKIKHRLHL